MHFDLIWRRLGRSSVLLVLLSIFKPLSLAQNPSEARANAAQELVRTVLARAGSPSAVSLELQNLSGLSAAEQEDIRQKLRAQFGAARVQIVAPERALADVTITLAQDVHGEIWIAEARHGETRDVAMVRVAQSGNAGMPRIANTLSLHKTLVWTQATRVLDVELVGEGDQAALLVLDGATVSLYRNRQSHWELEQSAPIASTHPWPRDLRGRLMVSKDHKFDALLPGMKCSGAADPGVSMSCAPSDDPWPIDGDEGARGFFGARNFFTGALAGGAKQKNATPFYSAAVTHDELLLAPVSGGIASSAGALMQPLAGSDIASVRDECGSGEQVLATGAGDFTQRDTLQAMDEQSGRLAPETSPLEFNGPITALWTAHDGKAAIAVSKNLTTGRYEAFIISVTCR